MVNEWFSAKFLVLETKVIYGYPWVTMVPCVGKMAERIIGPLS